MGYCCQRSWTSVSHSYMPPYCPVMGECAQIVLPMDAVNFNHLVMAHFGSSLANTRGLSFFGLLPLKCFDFTMFRMVPRLAATTIGCSQLLLQAVIVGCAVPIMACRTRVLVHFSD